MKRTITLKNMGEYVSQMMKQKMLPKKNKLTAIVLAIVLVFSFAFFTYFNNTAYAVKVNGNEVGVVRDREDFTLIIDSLKENFYKEYSTEVVFNEIIEYEKQRAKDEELTPVDQIESSLSRVLNFKIIAFEIKANSQTIAILPTKADAEMVLETVKKPYVDEENLQKVDFEENVVIEEVSIEIKNVKTVEETVKLIEQGTDEVKVHEVQAGESFWTIAEKYNLDVEDLEKANPEVNPGKLQIKQSISLIVPKPLLTVVTLRRQRYKESIPFPVEFEETSAIFKGQSKIKVSGKDGEREVYAEIIEQNNIEVSRNILEEKILLEPQKQIVLKGTKEPPPKIGTGSFNTPTRGTLTSRFGPRWGKMHQGIDFAAKVGTPIYASDGGKVTFAGTSGAYGKLVIIDHGGGFETYYAHGSKIVVSVGDKIYKGQKIAEVGNTGRTTGPNLHFEVRKNGTPVNPLTYVNAK